MSEQEETHSVEELENAKKALNQRIKKAKRIQPGRSLAIRKKEARKDSDIEEGMSLLADGLGTLFGYLGKFLDWLMWANKGNWAAVLVQVSLAFLAGIVYATFFM